MTVVAVLFAGLQSSWPAAAEPVYPSQNDVDKAKQDAAQALTDVKQIQAALDQSADQVATADLALSQAAEDYDEAQVELDNAKQAAAAATAAAKQAQAKLDDAQREVGQLASQTYRSGGPIGSLDVLFSPAGPDEVLERATIMQSVAAGQQRTVRRMDQARAQATALDRQAAHAVDVQNAAAAKLKAAEQAAQAKADAAHAALERQTKLKSVLVARLASARRTSVQVEQARQEGLEREAERRREEAAREAARRAAQANNDDNDNGGSGGGGGSSAPDPGGSSSGSAGGGASAVAWARTKVGLPYRWAGAGPGSYDCSGLTMKAWAQAGVSLPHSSRLQYRLTEHVSYGNLRKGDLIFYATNPSNPSTIHHVTMYAGNGMMVEAPYTGAYVRVVPLRKGYQAMPYAGRP